MFADTFLHIVLLHCNLVNTELGENAARITSFCFFNCFFGLKTQVFMYMQTYITHIKCSKEHLPMWLVTFDPQLHHTFTSLTCCCAQVVLPFPVVWASGNRKLCSSAVWLNWAPFDPPWKNSTSSYTTEEPQNSCWPRKKDRALRFLYLSLCGNETSCIEPIQSVLAQQPPTMLITIHVYIYLLN